MKISGRARLIKYVGVGRGGGESRFDEFEKRIESALRKPRKRAAIRAP